MSCSNITAAADCPELLPTISDVQMCFCISAPNLNKKTEDGSGSGVSHLQIFVPPRTYMAFTPVHRVAIPKVSGSN